ALGAEVAAWGELDPRFAQRAAVADQIASIDGTLRGHAEHRTKLARQRDVIVVDQRQATQRLVEVKARGASFKKKPTLTLDDARRLEDDARANLARAEQLVAIASAARAAATARADLDLQRLALAAAVTADHDAGQDARRRHDAATMLRDERARVAAELRRAGGYGHARAELVDGDPCPLCGAPEHPWADRGAFDDVIRDAERRLAEVVGALDEATATIARLEARAQAHAAADARLVAQRATAAASADEAAPIWREQLRSLGELAFADDPASPSAERLASERATAARAALDHARAAREQVAAAVKAAADAQAEVQLWQANADQVTTRLAELDRKIAELDATIERVRGERVGRVERHAELTTELDAAVTRWTHALPEAERAGWLDDEATGASLPRGRFARGSLSMAVPRTLAILAGPLAARARGKGLRADAPGDDALVEIDAHELGTHFDRARLAMAELASAWRTRTERVIEADAVLSLALAALDTSARRLDREIAEHAARHADAERRVAALAVEQADAQARFDDARVAAGLDDELDSDALFALLADSPARADQIAERLAALDRTLAVASGLVGERTRRVVEHVAACPALAGADPENADPELVELGESMSALAGALAAAGDLVDDPERPQRLAIAMQHRIDVLATTSATASTLAERQAARLAAELAGDDAARARRATALELLAGSERDAEVDRILGEVIGSHDGKLFRSFAQSLTLDGLLAVTNSHLEELAPRYQLERVPRHDLELQVIDRDLGGEVRSVQSLSGGESFLVSLALALGLSSMSAHDVRVRTLLIDEGFGTLDPATLDGALAVLDRLQATGRQVGVISHVPALVERVGAHIRVAPRGGGRSEVIVHN
ncbi:MAG: hypothetical protein NT062_23130, partial [Proteobacteria bacterium]|nr:hypothetical protein [Pseudomonadota bacterium]